MCKMGAIPYVAILAELIISDDVLEQLNEEIRRCTRTFPNTKSCLRLIRELAVAIHEDWLEANRYLNIDDLKERMKEVLQEAA